MQHPTQDWYAEHDRTSGDGESVAERAEDLLSRLPEHHTLIDAILTSAAYLHEHLAGEAGERSVVLQDALAERVHLEGRASYNLGYEDGRRAARVGELALEPAEALRMIARALLGIAEALPPSSAPRTSGEPAPR